MASAHHELSPLEAYEQVMQFAAHRGENALRLAFHAAVPQVLRPDLLHLLRLNFVPEALDDAAAEADVLFASFCEDLGNGYFRFDRNARLHLLMQLDPTYESDAVLRSQQVASFLLAYLDQQECSVAADSDLVYAAYREVERWVAFAFFNPDNAALQLAGAVKKACEPNLVAARMRIGGLASALATPLAQHQELLAYAAGIEAIEAGNVRHAQHMLENLGDREIRVGEVTLRSLRSVLKERLRSRGEKIEPEAQEEPVEPTPEKPVSVTSRPLNMGEPFDVFLSHNSRDKPTVRQLAKALQARGLQVWLGEEELVPGRLWQEALEKIIQTARAVAVLVGRDGLGPWERPEMRACLSEFVDRGLPVIPVLLPDAPSKPELPLFLREFTWVDLRGGLTDDGLKRLEWGITGVRPGQSSGSAEDRLHPKPVRDLIFISYSHKDKPWLERLKTIMAPFMRQGQLSVWADTDIAPGGNILWWNIEQGLARARVAVLLVSPDFLASRFIVEHDLPPLLQAAEREGVKILPVLLRECLWRETELAQYEFAFLTDKPLAALSKAGRDRALAQIAEFVSRSVQAPEDRDSSSRRPSDSTTRSRGYLTITRVFISSTAEDLKDYRAAARDAAIRVGLLSGHAGILGGEGQPAFRGVYGAGERHGGAGRHRRPPLRMGASGSAGSDPSGKERKSITWLECEQAIEDGHEVLAFILDDSVKDWPEKLPRGSPAAPGDG